MSPENELAIQEEFSPVELDTEARRIVKQASDLLLYEKLAVSWDKLIVGYENGITALESETAIREAEYSRCLQAEHNPACLKVLGATSLDAVSDARIILGTEEVSAAWDSPVAGYETLGQGTVLRKIGAKLLAFAEWSAQIRDQDGRTIAYGYSAWNGLAAIPVDPPDAAV